MKYTCDGSDVSLPLVFADIPAGTQSLALIMDDPDAPMGTWVHWVVYNIPPDLEGLPEAVPPVPLLDYGIRQGVNDFGKTGYGGPCPPGGTHRYFIKLYALDVPMEEEAGLSKAELLSLMKGHVIAEAKWMGTYSR